MDQLISKWNLHMISFSPKKILKEALVLVITNFCQAKPSFQFQLCLVSFIVNFFKQPNWNLDLKIWWREGFKFVHGQQVTSDEVGLHWFQHKTLTALVIRDEDDAWQGLGGIPDTMWNLIVHQMNILFWKLYIFRKWFKLKDVLALGAGMFTRNMMSFIHQSHWRG